MLKFSLLALAVVGLMLPAVPAEAKNDKHMKEEYHHDAVVVKRNGPPDHAPAHGYRAKFMHYPDHDIYFNTASKHYYKRINGKWVIYEKPLTLDLGAGVSVDLEEAIPAAIRMLD